MRYLLAELLQHEHPFAQRSIFYPPDADQVLKLHLKVTILYCSADCYCGSGAKNLASVDASFYLQDEAYLGLHLDHAVQKRH
jgi:hypothetical protein